MAGMSNKISNVLGVPIPAPLRMQFAIRSQKNLGGTKENNYFRDNDNLVYQANKTSWVRLVSSINVKDTDLSYFQTSYPELKLKDETDLSKQFVLFGGTSVYDKDKYNLRYGIGSDLPAYGILGAEEIKQFGYRPMPGITDVKIDTQGRLGSIRMATINFKVWDKFQLDIMDALYFKLGYTMFLEWGHTVYYNNDEQLKTSEFEQIDPFETGVKKETILRKIAKNIDKTNGNYDGMLGMCTNFNFSYNQEGGFDCTVKIIALGALADSTKLNQTQALPSLYSNTIAKLVNKLTELKQDAADEEARKEKEKKQKEDAENATKTGTVVTTKETIPQRANRLRPDLYPTTYIGSGEIFGSLVNVDTNATLIVV